MTDCKPVREIMPHLGLRIACDGLTCPGKYLLSIIQKHKNDLKDLTFYIFLNVTGLKGL